MSKQFQEMMELIKRLEDRYCGVLWSFYSFKYFSEKISDAFAEKKDIEANKKTYERFGNFFGPAISALRFHFLLDLAKFFDEEQRNVSLSKPIARARTSKELSKKDFLEFHAKREFVETLADAFTGLSEEDLKMLSQKKKPHLDVINRLIMYRKKYLAHDDFDRQSIKITEEEVKGLIEMIRETLDLLLDVYNASSTRFSIIEAHVRTDVNYLFSVLNEAEKLRLQGIKDFYTL